MEVRTYTLCAQHDVYYTQACPGCYFQHLQRDEQYTGRPAAFFLHEVAILARTSTRWPLVV